MKTNLVTRQKYEKVSAVNSAGKQKRRVDTMVIIKPATKEECLYSFRQHPQIASQTGCIGYLRGDFGKTGQEFFTSWFPISNTLKTEFFCKELDKTVNYLRSIKCGLLADRAHMRGFCAAFPEDEFERGPRCCFRIDTEAHTFILSCTPNCGDYNFYIYCYVRKWFTNHLQDAKGGIRFVDTDYNELFRINDGDRIEVVSLTGDKSEYECRFISGYHVLINNKVFHIMEFAERMEQLGKTYRPVKN